MECEQFVTLAKKLEESGLDWYPEIGDEIVERTDGGRVSVLVDPDGLSLLELRSLYVWLPTVEQLVERIEELGGIIFHFGQKQGGLYQVVVHGVVSAIDTSGESVRETFADALCRLIRQSIANPILH